MSKISIDNLKKISHLSKIKIHDNDKEELSSKLNEIIVFFNKIKEVDTSNIEPLTNINDQELILHKDKISDANIEGDILFSNSKNHKYNYFTVPKVIDTDS